ncbi:uncharacterized protein EV422DRAFT_525604 [Fimicolochytrium jonesii]|uniref:uncharacterized protein n=1 Tax=Fimicolochytrium jonesii TaxID=1396493 RepID=UPI0022FE8E05|nr:uncharacterized protein EV422DRAFT_525604 [Fimicolochytrium jonesii]KAI8822085.1 hypothetical protein EV422DRAFT_525604 [Fimicolochytrium jonesii]
MTHGQLREGFPMLADSRQPTDLRSEVSATQTELSRCLTQITSLNPPTRLAGFAALRQILESEEDEEAFRETQRVSECEVMQTLLTLLQKHLPKHSHPPHRNHTPQNPSLSLLALDILQGVALRDAASKSVVGRGGMETLATYALSHTDALTAAAALEAIQCILVDSCVNLEIFDTSPHLLAICALLKQAEVPFLVKRKCIELLTIYLSAPPTTEDTRNDSDRQERWVGKQGERQARVARVLGQGFVRRLGGGVG